MRRLSSGLFGLVLVGSAGLVACGDDSSGSSAAPTTVAAASGASVPAAATTIIDVRTPQEYAAGHLAGAVNFNVEDGTLEAALGTLDPAGSYSVYCQSGRRSGIATALLTSKGYANVTDLGGIDEAAATTGLAIVASA